MQCTGANRLSQGRSRISPASLTFGLFLALLPFIVSGCHRVMPVDTAPLDAAGMSYDAIQQAKALKITASEVTELAKARQSGLSDAGCVGILQIFHGRGQAFNAGDAAAGLIQAGMGEQSVLELARLKQLGIGEGELQAMRLAGLSDDIILEVARQHAQGKAVLSGASLAEMKNTGMRNSTLLELAQRGIPDSETNAIIALRRRGANDAEILRRFSGS